MKRFWRVASGCAIVMAILSIAYLLHTQIDVGGFWAVLMSALIVSIVIGSWRSRT